MPIIQGSHNEDVSDLKGGVISFSKLLVLIPGGAEFISSHTADELIRKGYRIRIGIGI